jgi:hypothetical protein
LPSRRAARDRHWSPPDTHVDSLRLGFADRHDFLLLEKAQQLGLHVERQIADFVEEQRAVAAARTSPG